MNVIGTMGSVVVVVAIVRSRLNIDFVYALVSLAV